MATACSATSRALAFSFGSKPFLKTNPGSKLIPSSVILTGSHQLDRKRVSNFPGADRLKISCVINKKPEDGLQDSRGSSEKKKVRARKQLRGLTAKARMERKKAERETYLIAATVSSIGITSMAVMAVFYRFSWLLEGGEIPLLEMFGTVSLAVGAAVGMEFWARWAHRALWHASLWSMHQSHHRPREGVFELNDVFAVINSVPAVALLSYGFFNRGLFAGLCFGAGLGITVFGMAYMLVHDGLVHRRFPVGPIDRVPYLRRVAAAHQIHRSEKFSGIPYGLFLGPRELKKIGGTDELEKEVQRKIKLSEPFP